MATIEQAGVNPLLEFRVRLDPQDVHRLRERALAESRGGRLVYWTDFLRTAIREMAEPREVAK